jgi:hypothetical protein
MAGGTGSTAPASAAAQQQPAAGKKPARKKAAASEQKKTTRKRATAGAAKTAASKTTAAANPAPAATASEGKSALSSGERQRMINDAAYLISLKRHAGANGPDADWLYAETVIDMVFDTTD